MIHRSIEKALEGSEYDICTIRINNVVRDNEQKTKGNRKERKNITD